MVALELDFEGLDELDDYLQDVEQRASNISPVAPRILADLVEQNRGIRFNPGHPDSILGFRQPATFFIGSRRTKYGELLNTGAEFMMDTIIEWILDGRK